MLPAAKSLAKSAFSDPAWVFEAKLDQHMQQPILLDIGHIENDGVDVFHDDRLARWRVDEKGSAVIGAVESQPGMHLYP